MHTDSNNLLARIFSTVFFLIAVCPLQTLAADSNSQAFVHPGIAHTAASLQRIKSELQSSKDPRATEWENFKKSPFANLDWEADPSADVERGPYNKPDVGSSEFYSDGTAAYSLALRWVLSGDDAYAKKSAEIIDAWSTTLKTVTNHDAKLLVGMVGQKYCNAAELLRHTWDGWPESNQENFRSMLRNVWYPVIEDFYPSANGNWDASMMQTMIAMGVFLDDREMFERAVNYYLEGEGNGAIGNYFNEFGECQESGRDQAHTQMGLEFLANTAETAWSQGVDLFGALDNRLLLGFEYTAKYNLGFDVAYQPYRSFEGRYFYEELSSDSRGGLRPMYDKVYNHFHNRMGFKAVYTSLAADKSRDGKREPKRRRRGRRGRRDGRRDGRGEGRRDRGEQRRSDRDESSFNRDIDDADERNSDHEEDSEKTEEELERERKRSGLRRHGTLPWDALMFRDVSGSPSETLASQTKSNEDLLSKDRMEWWKRAKFGMFIHWGVYSAAGGEWNGETDHHEWLQFTAKIPLAEYKEFARGFNPKKFDADQWVKIAKDAGMKYMVITAKHHDGFAMYYSASNAHNVVKGSKFKRDPIMGLARACKRHGIKFCVYYSLGRDWEDPDVPTGTGKTKPGWRSNLIDFPNESEKDFQKYFDRKVKPQVRELLTRYGPIGVMWFDTSERINKEQSEELVAMIRKLQPACIINGRVGNGLGDYKVAEQKIPSSAGDEAAEPWETCMTMNDHWGYNKADQDWRSSENLIHKLIDIVSKGGNFLLNVGPTGEGLIPDPSVNRLNEMGQWLRINGEAIYDCGPTPYGDEISSWDWRATTKPGKIFIHVLKLPKGDLELPVADGTITKAYWLGDEDQKPLKYVSSKDGVAVSLPKKPAENELSKMPVVICLEIDSPPLASIQTKTR